MSKDRGAKRDRVLGASRRETLQSDPQRESRENADAERMDEGFELSLEEREQMLRDDALQNQLPTPPKKPGIHWFWGSLTNQYTSIVWYMRLGYRPVKMDDPLIKGWATANMRGANGDYAGCVTVNEMILMKGSDVDYQRFMKVVHHEKPMAEQERMRDTLRNVQDVTAQEAGRDDVVVDGAAPGEASGLKSLERRAKRPSRFE